MNKSELGRSELDKNPSELKRSLNLFDLVVIGLSSTIGAGIFVLTGTVASEIAGPAVIVSYLISGFASLLNGLCYCEMASKYPRSGSAYSYCQLALGEGIAFIVGWNLILEYTVGSAAITRSFTHYILLLNKQSLNVYIPTLDLNENLTLVLDSKNYLLRLDYLSCSVTLLVTLLLLLGIKKFNYLNIVGSIITFVSIALIIIFGIPYVDLNKYYTNFAPYGVQGIITGASTCFFAFIGFDVISTLGDEAKEPKRNLPLSIIITVTMCIVLYVATSFILTSIAPLSYLKNEAPFTMAFIYHNNFYATWIVGLGATFGLLTSIFSSMIPVPRIMYIMSLDGFLSNCFSKIYKPTSVPIITTIFGGILSGILSFLLTVEDLVEIMSIGTLLAYTMVSIGVITSRYSILKNNSIDDYSIAYRCLMVLLLFNLISFLILALIWVYATEYIVLDLGYLDIKKTIITLLMIVLICICLITQIMFKVIISCYSSILNNKTGEFTVPLVPFVPFATILINIVLMVSLRKFTWIRFTVWMIIGLFVYSYKYSKEKAKNLQRVDSKVMPDDKNI